MGEINKDELQIALNRLAEEKIQKLEREAAAFDYVPSRRFKRRMNRLLRSERYFGKHFRVGYALRRVAVFVILISALALTGTVSAKMFGFRPWEYIMKFSEENKTEDRYYHVSEKKQDTGGMAVVRHDAPVYVPEGYREIENEVRDDGGCDAAWKKTEDSGLYYARDVIEDGMLNSTDAEYTVSEKIEISGYEAYYRKKGIYEWVMWNDAKYAHMLYSVRLTGAKEELVRMAESLYE